MKLFRFGRRTFALLLIAVWGLYAGLNGAAKIPALSSAFGRGWGLENKLDLVVETANGDFLYQGFMQDLYGRALGEMGRETVHGFSMAKADDGRLLYTNFYPYALHDYEEAALRMRQLAQSAQAQGTSFLYLNCIDLYQAGSTLPESLVANDMNPDADAFLRDLMGYGVEYLDAREALQASGLAPAQQLYRAEPHWTIEACFEVYRALVAQLQAQGSAIDPTGFYTSPQLYTREQITDRYLGKLGKLTGAPYADYDAYTLIMPAYETSLSLAYGLNDTHRARHGDFASVLLDSRWTGNSSVYQDDLYAMYLTDVYPYRRITNHLNPDGPSILLVGDSFMLPVAAFLSLAASEVHLLSPYSLPSGTASLEEFLQANPVDHIVVGLSPGTLRGNGFAFLNGIALPQLP